MGGPGTAPGQQSQDWCRVNAPNPSVTLLPGKSKPGQTPFSSPSPVCSDPRAGAHLSLSVLGAGRMEDEPWGWMLMFQSPSRAQQTEHPTRGAVGEDTPTSHCHREEQWLWSRNRGPEGEKIKEGR